jgi:hypothetical protein
MNDFTLFLLIFFGIIGVVRTASLAYTYIIQKIVFKKVDFVKIWTKQ